MYKKINNSEIKKMIEGTVPCTTEYEPFVIIKEKITSLITNDVSWDWKIILNPLKKKKNYFRIEKTDALAIIDNMAMYEACKNKYGKVFERPGKSFFEKYKGTGLSIPDNLAF